MEYDDDRDRDDERIRRLTARVARVREQVARLRAEQQAASADATAHYAEYVRSTSLGPAGRPAGTVPLRPDPADDAPGEPGG